MNYVAYDSFCIRCVPVAQHLASCPPSARADRQPLNCSICTDANSTYSAATMCEHTFDLMGCQWVMPGDYTEGTFT